MLPIGYTQSNGSGLDIKTRVLPLSIIGDPIPAAHYKRIQGLRNAIYPQKYFGEDKTQYGPLRGNSWKN